MDFFTQSGKGNVGQLAADSQAAFMALITPNCSTGSLDTHFVASACIIIVINVLLVSLPHSGVAHFNRVSYSLSVMGVNND